MSPDASATRLGSKLFLSCDLVGSTGHKQTAARPRAWLPDFLSFYYDFPALVRGHLGDGLSARLVFWKAVGDELLYVADVDHEKQVHKIVKAWLRAMDDYEERLVDRNRKIADDGEITSAESVDAAIVNKMKLKGGAFLATFPVPDFIVAVPRQPQDALSERDPFVVNRGLMNGADADRLLDYLGPGIDTGFRVVHESSQRYFTMSLEVAWAIAHHAHYGPQRRKVVKGVTLLREAALKGVWQGREYPLFAIDRHAKDKVVRHLNKVRGTKPIEARAICRLAERCLESADWPSRIYFHGSAETSFTSMRDELEAARDEFDAMVDRSGESLDMAETTDGPDDGRDPAAMVSKPPRSGLP